jgi:hypothetical protein
MPYHKSRTDTRPYQNGYTDTELVSKKRYGITKWGVSLNTGILLRTLDLDFPEQPSRQNEVEQSTAQANVESGVVEDVQASLTKVAIWAMR